VFSFYYKITLKTQTKNAAHQNGKYNFEAYKQGKERNPKLGDNENRVGNAGSGRKNRGENGGAMVPWLLLYARHTDGQTSPPNSTHANVFYCSSYICGCSERV